jgi:hypothetical protein
MIFKGLTLVPNKISSILIALNFLLLLGIELKFLRNTYSIELLRLKLQFNGI